MRGLVGLLVAGAVVFFVVQHVGLRTSHGAVKSPRLALVPGQLIATGQATPLTPAQARRLVSKTSPADRRDLSCALDRAERTIVVCTFLANGLQAGEEGALGVRTNKDGTVTEFNMDSPPATLDEFVAAADTACIRRSIAVDGLPRLPSLQQTARLLPIEQRFEAALVPVSAVPTGHGGLAASRFFGDFLDYEFSLGNLHRRVLEQAPLNLTQQDLVDARGGAVLASRDAAGLGISCDFRIYLEPPPAPAVKPAPPAPARSSSPSDTGGMTSEQAVQIVAANPNNIDIHCRRGSNGWSYICSYFNAAQPHRSGILAHGPDGRPLEVVLGADGPIPPPPHR